ncbi:WhiB family transcriptional regulator [Rhodococcoides kroppenstedtii]|uniref:WhiB family transcriptional regulator n=1 Tax=Rhodococcoides kroppenstedtii TaxID=293050 RepID=UPI00362F5D14
MAHLDRIRAPRDTSGPEAARLLRAAGIATSTTRAALAARQRRGSLAVARAAPLAPTSPHGPDPVPEAAVLAVGLEDAACRGLQPAFDAEVHGETGDQADERLRGAIAVCRRCPVTDACDAARRVLPPRLVRGVWAGELFGRDWP